MPSPERTPAAAPATIHAIAAVGDAADLHCWSGLPYYFGSAARRKGEPAVPWRVTLPDFAQTRWWWNLQSWARGRGVGGFQYSTAFLDRAEAAIPGEAWQGRVLTFNQHFPRGRSVAARGGRALHYLDATFASLARPGGLLGRLPDRVRAEALALERENLATSEWVVAMARWTADSAVRDCGVPVAKVATILPGANLELPAEFAFAPAAGQPGRDRPLVLGFVGKDWRRKGLPFLREVRAELERMGFPAVVRCAGHCPPGLRRAPGLEYVGFIDKARQPQAFVDFLASCDVGCLFSAAEPLGISTLEFLRVGVPVAGFMVEGIADTVPPDAGFRIELGTAAGEVAGALRRTFSDEAATESLRAAARAWSPRVTWERCVREWQQLLTGGVILDPVRPWLGLAPAALTGTESNRP